MRKGFLTAGVLIGIGLIAATMAAGGVPGKKFGQETASGEYAIAVASGSVNRPRAIYVRVKSRPNQKATGAWNIVCSKGFGAGSRRGQLRGRTPFVRKLTMSYRHPSSCTASASAQLSSGGFVKVQLYATR